MRLVTAVIAFYFLVIAAANVYFVSALQSGAAVAAGAASFILMIERPLTWLLNKIKFLYVGNMTALSDVTMRSSIIMLSASLLLLIGFVMMIRAEADK
jgi:hypothetical protein